MWSKIKKVLFMDILPKKTMKYGEHISVVLYNGDSDYEADSLVRYIDVFKSSEQPLLVEDGNGNDVYVKVEDVTCMREFLYDDRMIYKVKMKGEILK